jgi:hypothetical protein
MKVAYATLVRECYRALDIDLILWALIIKGYLLGLIQDANHFDIEVRLFRYWDQGLWMSVSTNWGVYRIDFFLP